MIVGAKLVDVGAVPAFLATGMASVPYRRVLAWNAPATAVRAGVLVLLGVLAGRQIAAALLAEPWLAAAAGLALALSLTTIRALVVRVVSRRGARRPCAS